MTITEILASNKKDATKLNSINTVVNTVRKAYGNRGVPITVPEVVTASGLVSFSSLDDESKLEFIRQAVIDIREDALSSVSVVEGLNLTKYVEYRIATSPILTTINRKVDLGLL